MRVNNLSADEKTNRIIAFIQEIPFKKIFSAIRQAPTFPTITIFIFIICGVFGKLIAPHDPTAAILGGYLGGKIDLLTMRLVDMVLSMPILVLAVSLAAVLGASKYNLIIILAFISWAWYARVLFEVFRPGDAPSGSSLGFHDQRRPKLYRSGLVAQPLARDGHSPGGLK